VNRGGPFCKWIVTFAQLISPKGATESSLAIHRQVNGSPPKFMSPLGDDRFYVVLHSASVVPTGLHFCEGSDSPGDESPGYYRESLRDSNDPLITNRVDPGQWSKRHNLFAKSAPLHAFNYS
jgi:hypothetical protein